MLSVAIAFLLNVGLVEPVRAAELLDLQLQKQSNTVNFRSSAGVTGKATLINVNPQINAWFVLAIDAGPLSPTQKYHLENVAPATQSVVLDGTGTLVLSDKGSPIRCRLLPGEAPDTLAVARASGLPYAPLCQGRLYLRNSVVGHATSLELASDFLRDHVWGGEQIVGFIKTRLLYDAFLEKVELVDLGKLPFPFSAPKGVPPAARLGNAPLGQAILPTDLGIEVERAATSASPAMTPGQWYPVRGMPGISVSALQAVNIGITALSNNPRTTGKLDAVESTALNYLVAFDLRQFDLGFALGTDHPRLGWSERTHSQLHDASKLGPDGFDSAAPLVRTGMVSPALLSRIAATFTGGFKREHGAFEYGSLAHRDEGSYYGFIEQGTVFSSLRPGLATLYVLDDGSVGMKTWEHSDDVLLPRIRHARQNGVALLEKDPESGLVEAGVLVSQWAAGNWSGSIDEKQRTLRAGACIVETPTERFLIYGYFSSATPLLMAQVFKSYGCSYAMHLDMNALEHTYLAVYRRSGGTETLEHLIRGMDAVDDKTGDKLAPRFLAVPDNRDFFYLLRK